MTNRRIMFILVVANLFAFILFRAELKQKNLASSSRVQIIKELKSIDYIYDSEMCLKELDSMVESSVKGADFFELVKPSALKMIGECDSRIKGLTTYSFSVTYLNNSNILQYRDFLLARYLLIKTFFNGKYKQYVATAQRDKIDIIYADNNSYIYLQVQVILLLLLFVFVLSSGITEEIDGNIETIKKIFKFRN